MELLVGLACILLILIPVLLIQAMVLRWACQLSGVEPPDYGWAIIILFTNGIVSSIIQMAIFFVYIGGNMAAARNNPQVGLVPNLIAFPVTLVTSTGIYSSMLGTSLGRAFVILLMNFLIYFVMCCLPAMVMSGVGQLPK